MPQDEYVIVQTGDRWKVVCDGRSVGDCAERFEALRSAVRLADAAGASGIPASVLTQDGHGIRHVVWTYGRDAFTKEA